MCFCVVVALWSTYAATVPSSNDRPKLSLRTNVYLPGVIRLANPAFRKAALCRLQRHRNTYRMASTRIPTSFTVGKLFHHVVGAMFGTFYRGNGSLAVQHVPRNSSVWGRLSTCTGADLWTCMFGAAATDDASCTHATLSHTKLGDTDHDVITFAGAIARRIAPNIHHPLPVLYVHNVVSDTPLNISVHARFGDACDYFLSAKRPYGKEYWQDGKNKRPCFTFDSYMREIGALATRYRTRNLLVETDSPSFLRRLLQNKTYNYYFVDDNGGRAVFDVCASTGGVCGSHDGWLDHRNESALTAAAADLSLQGLWLLQVRGAVRLMNII